MAQSWFDRMLVFFGFEAEAAAEEEDEVRREREEERARVASLASRKTTVTGGHAHQGGGGPARGRLVSLPGGDAPGTVVIVHPRSFAEVQQITDRLKSRHPVIVNLGEADADAAQRIVNFLSGAVYALDGEMQRIGGGVLFFAPSNIHVERLVDKHGDPAAGEPAHDMG